MGNREFKDRAANFMYDMLFGELPAVEEAADIRAMLRGLGMSAYKPVEDSSNRQWDVVRYRALCALAAVNRRRAQEFVDQDEQKRTDEIGKILLVLAAAAGAPAKTFLLAPAGMRLENDQQAFNRLKEMLVASNHPMLSMTRGIEAIEEKFSELRKAWLAEQKRPSTEAKPKHGKKPSKKPAKPRRDKPVGEGLNALAAVRDELPAPTRETKPERPPRVVASSRGDNRVTLGHLHGLSDEEVYELEDDDSTDEVVKSSTISTTDLPIQSAVDGVH